MPNPCFTVYWFDEGFPEGKIIALMELDFILKGAFKAKEVFSKTNANQLKWKPAKYRYGTCGLMF